MYAWTDRDEGDQYVQKKPQLVQQKDGKMVVVDGPRTLQFMYNAFYWYELL